MPEKYVLGVLSFIYDNIKSSIVFKDDITHEIYNLNNNIRINAKLRVDTDAKYEEIREGCVQIQKINNRYVEIHNIDYIIEYNKHKYIVPQEVLDEHLCISISELDDWLIESQLAIFYDLC